jgi:pimeloyl-ACP methyl ester carboxylesterase
MANYLLLHGAARTAWIWHRVEAGLRELGHETVAPDLPQSGRRELPDMPR